MRSFCEKMFLAEVKAEFDLDDFTWSFEPSYNIAPTQEVAGIISRNGARQVVRLRWGLIPSWSKDPEIGNRMINARAETLAQKPSFAKIFRRQRCLIIADGFYEWQSTGSTKVPMYVHLRSDKPFGFAGLYSIWHADEHTSVTTCTIITTNANALLAPIHNRMPVIIRPEGRKLWLDEDVQDPEELQPLLVPYKPDEMEAYPVSRMVNSPANNTADCIKPVSEK